jgi:hypothetical protein
MNRQRLWALALSASLLGAVAIASCGDGGSGDTAATGAAGSATTGPGDGGSGGNGGSGGGVIDFDSGGEETLTIVPKDVIIDVTGVPQSVPLKAKLSDGSSPSNVVWLLDDVTVGTISTDGVFLSQGFVAGKAQVTAQWGNLTASASITVRAKLLENPGNLSAADQAVLEAGGAGDPAWKFLYPYDKTIFPRGLDAPSLQFGGAAADATYIRIKFGDFEYKGFFGPSTPPRVELPANIWKAVTTSATSTDTVEITATKLSGGMASGPATQTWKIAQGSLKGVIYYNTYISKLTNTGAVMRVRPGQSAEVLIGGCAVCHSVSANGAVLVSGVDWTVDNPLDSASFDLLQDGSTAVRFQDSDGRKFAFGGLTPDGSRMLGNGVPVNGPRPRGLANDFPSKLWDTKTGQEIAAPSFTSMIQYALTPAFSPDGKKVAFNWLEKSLGTTLAVMDYDGTQTPPLFSNLTEVVNVPTGVAAWPSFTADSKGVLYHQGDAFDTAGYGGTPLYADVRLVDLTSQAVSSLNALNGYEPAGKAYLPYGEAEEAHLNYEPNVLPVPVGGYYWVLFTSRRAYGNTIAPGGTVPNGDNKWGQFVNGGEIPSPRKKLWIAAIDLDFQGKLDPSHPAFYLPGQELEAGNMRAFAALEPCKADGTECESAAECCGGFCRQVESMNGGPPEVVCVPPPGGCSNADELCSTAADCCAPGALCINGHCALPTPQ